MFDCFYIFKSFTFQSVFNLGEEEKVIWGHVWGVQGMTHLLNVVFG
jgi:hypothetical protein